MTSPRLTIISLLLAAMWWCAGPARAVDGGVIPAPLSIQHEPDSFIIAPSTRIYTNLQGRERKLMADYIATLPRPLDKKFHRGLPSSPDNAIVLLKTSDANSSPEGYTLDISPRGITIRSAGDTGLFYGLQTLLQLVTMTGDGSLKASAALIEDTPRLEYRGVMIDVSRHFRSKEFLKKQIDAMARYKLNRLHLHLTDAAGWRIEIPGYPRLTEFAAWRPEANWKKWWNAPDGRRYCEQSDPRACGGYYTRDDLRELVEYAAMRHITIVPEIEMPAHSEEVLAAYPGLSCQGKPYTSADFCVGNEQTFSFLEDVLTYVMEIFPSEYIHIGGDEAAKTAWKTCPRCAARMHDEGLADVDALQNYLISRISSFLLSHGRKPIGWDEIMDDSLAAGTAIMSWRGEEGGLRAVRNGLRTIMTPGSHCYIDQYQDAPHTQPEAIGGYLPLSRIHSYNPVPDSLSESEARLIYGVQANLWAEYIETDSHYEYMLYPRVMALAEVAWSDPSRKSYAGFHTLALRETDRLRDLGYHPFPLGEETGPRPESTATVSHLAIGKPVIYNAPYNATYAEQGDKTLTDGKRGGWTYSDGAWQGFISRDRLDVTVDLEADTLLRSVSADFLQVTGPEVYLPAETVISVSSDGVSFSELTRITRDYDPSAPFVIRNIGWQGDTRGRYIRIQARSDKNMGGWIFTDEIIIN